VQKFKQDFALRHRVPDVPTYFMTTTLVFVYLL